MVILNNELTSVNVNNRVSLYTICEFFDDFRHGVVFYIEFSGVLLLLSCFNVEPHFLVGLVGDLK